MTAPAPALVSPSPSGGGPVPSQETRRLRALERRPAVPRAFITRRQIEILRLAANGNTNRAIARTLGVGEETVKSQMQVMFRKLQVSDRAQAVGVAMRVGLLTVNDIGLPPGLAHRYGDSA